MSRTHTYRYVASSAKSATGRFNDRTCTARKWQKRQLHKAERRGIKDAIRQEVL